MGLGTAGGRRALSHGASDHDGIEPLGKVVAQLAQLPAGGRAQRPLGADLELGTVEVALGVRATQQLDEGVTLGVADSLEGVPDGDGSRCTGLGKGRHFERRQNGRDLAGSTHLGLLDSVN